MEPEDGFKEPKENILIEAKLKYAHTNLKDVKFQYRYGNANHPQISKQMKILELKIAQIQ